MVDIGRITKSKYNEDGGNDDNVFNHVLCLLTFYLKRKLLILLYHTVFLFFVTECFELFVVELCLIFIVYVKCVFECFYQHQLKTAEFPSLKFNMYVDYNLE